MSKQEGITVKKSENFSEWYTQAIIKSGLADYGPVQGNYCFKGIFLSDLGNNPRDFQWND
jgi:prolyl-tRNA synthetase